MESGAARRRVIGVPFDPDEPDAGGPVDGDDPEGRVWGAGDRSGPRLVAPAAPPPSRRRGATHLRDLTPRTRPPALARERALPVPGVLHELFPDGLRRGSTVGVTGPGATSFALALVTGAADAGSWVVTVGLDDLGLAAATELGVRLERLAVVAAPPPAEWGTVVAALIGAVDVVLVAPRERVRSGDLRRLEARSRERGSVLVQLGDPARWPGAHDLVVTLRAPRWSGVGRGHGRLAARHVLVEVTGRREASRPRRAELLLPGPDGRLAAPAPAAVAPPVGAWAGADIQAGAADPVMAGPVGEDTGVTAPWREVG